ncbi:MAG: hypothetical protein LHV68_01965 [Elusimicrobia bacterium]|nr:hypothetical protein [Candidatus Liberimonas magnetica]
MRKAFCYVLAVLILSLLSNLLLYAEEVEIKSGYLQYDDQDKYLVARDSVTLTWKNKLLKADTIYFWVDEDKVRADGYVVLRDSSNVIFGDSLTYDLKTETGTINKSSCYFSPWVVHSNNLTKINDKTYIAGTSKFTTCDLIKPHYYIYGSRAKILTGKRIYIYNPVFLVRNMPVFYMPLFTQGLGKKRDSLEIYPGYNNLDGITARVIYGHPLTEHTYSKLYLDYFAKRGLGTGLEYNYDIPGKIRGTFYGYNIKEKITDPNGLTTSSERWNLKEEHWQKLSPYWTAQSKLDFISDASFNNLYYQENWMRIARELNSSLAFTRQTPKSSFRMTTARRDVYDTIINDFKADNISFPLLEYTRYPKKTFLGLYFTYNTNLLNQYIALNDFYTWSSASNFNIYKNYNLTRKLTLTPSLGMNETWSDRTPKLNASNVLIPGNYDLNNIFVSRFLSDFNLKYRVMRAMDWNLLHQYKLRTKKNLMDIDTNGDDYGEETNQVVFRNSMYLSRRVIVRNSATYDFRRSRTIFIEDWRQKFSPLVNELTWQPAFSYTIYVKEATNIYPHTLNSVQTLFMYGNRDDKYLNLGLFYNGLTPTQADFNVGLGFNPTAKWRVEYNIYSTETRDFREIRTNDQELKVARDLHCWMLGLRFLRRLAYEEVYLSIDLKTSFKKRKELYNRPHEQEFYPWR